MRSLRDLGRNETVRRALCWLGAQYIRLVHVTSRWSVVGGDAPRQLWDRGEPFILCFWHGRLMMMPYCWDHRAKIRTLTSHHPDGRLIAQTTAHFGIPTLTGSSRRGGVAALRAMARALKSGESIGMTPDGPRGPRMRASPGAVALAGTTGAAILPIAFSTTRGRTLGSWDRFLLAMPFGRGVLVWGEPIRVDRELGAAGLDQARRRLEDALNAATAEADRLCGRRPIEPEPERPEDDETSS